MRDIPLSIAFGISDVGMVDGVVFEGHSGVASNVKFPESSSASEKVGIPFVQRG